MARMEAAREGEVIVVALLALRRFLGSWEALPVVDGEVLSWVVCSLGWGSWGLEGCREFFLSFRNSGTACREVGMGIAFPTGPVAARQHGVNGVFFWVVGYFLTKVYGRTDSFNITREQTDFTTCLQRIVLVAQSSCDFLHGYDGSAEQAGS